MSNNLQQRIIVGVVGAPLIFFSAIYANWLFAVIVLAMVIGSLMEYFRMLEAVHITPVLHTGYVFGVLIFTDALFFNGKYVPFILLAFMIILSSMFFIRRSKKWLSEITGTLAGTVYISLLYSVVFLIISDVNDLTGEARAGGKIVSMIFLCIWSLDTFAYAFGKSIGKRPFFQFISPKKTLEGAAGGFAASVAAAVAAQLIYLPFLNIWGAVCIGVIIGIFGQIGDLVESAVKRYSGVKDSSFFIPGHGGVLDRFDSLLFSLPVVYAYVKYFIF